MSDSRFLRLPLEIREHIYSYLLSPASAVVTLPDDYIRYSYDLRLLLVNHQIHAEALSVFRRLNIFIQVTTQWPDAQRYILEDGRVAMVVFGRAADKFDEKVHLKVEIRQTQGYDYSMGQTYKFVLLLQDLASFARVWYYSDLSQGGGGALNGHLGLTLTIGNPWNNWDKDLPKALQQKLLLPFGDVKELDEMKITGSSVYDSVKQEMKKRMDVPYETPEECIARAVELKDEGNRLLQAKQYRDAVDKYLQSFLAIHIVCHGHVRQVWANAFFEQVALTTGDHAGQPAQLARLILRVKLVANVCLAYLKLEEYAETRFWGMRTIGLMRSGMGIFGDEDEDQPMLGFVAAGEMGKIYYRTGVAAKMMGDKVEARRLLKVARGYLPEDQKVRQDYTSVALRI